MDKLPSVHGFTASEQLGGFYLNVVRGNTEEFEGTYIFIYLGGIPRVEWVGHVTVCFMSQETIEQRDPVFDSVTHSIIKYRLR